MARISDIELERLKREVSLERLVEAKGVKLERRGPDNFVGRCLFHSPDETPSFTVSRAKNLWHCLGACQRGGSVIDFVMLSEGVGFRHAVELLREGTLLAASAAGAAAPPPKHATARKLPAPVDFDADDTKLLGQVVDYYHRRLKETPAALEYLTKRGVGAAVDTFKLGFADRTLGLRLPSAATQAGGDIRGRLRKLGVFRESGHEHLAGSVVVPLADALGCVRGLYGRKVTPNLRAGTPLHLYLPGPHRAVFNERALVKQSAVILCEALIDALSFWVAGFKNVTCAYGVEGFTPMHLEVLKGCGAKNIFIAYDRDDAGDKAAIELGAKLFAEGFACWRVLFPRGTDANDCVAKRKEHAAQVLAATLRQSQWMGPDGAARPPPPLGPLSPLAAEVKPRWQWTAEEKEREANEVRERGLRQLSMLPSAAAKENNEPQVSSSASNSAATESVMSAAAPTEPSSSAAPSPSAAPAAGSPAMVMPTEPAPATVTTLESSAGEISAPPSPSPSSNSDVGDERVFHFGPRRYRVRGLSKNSSPESLKLNVLVSAGDAFHVDTFDLYQAKARAHFVASAAAELRLEPDVVKHDVGQLLLQVEGLQEQARKAAEAPKTPMLTEGERDAALELLRSPNLLERVLADFEKCGVVGEETNKLVGYLAAVSRKLEEPLAVLIQSSSAAGKSSLMEAVLAFVPDEDKVKYSAMTGQSLFYMGDLELKHKVLAVVEEEGAARASYALKLLQSEGELTIASTGKNPSTGRLETHEYHVEGPTQLFLTTTASELDEELLNRCLVLTVDEERAQTQAIHRLQREKQTLEGLLARRARETTLKVHQNAQRLLRSLLVANPYAKSLTFLDDRTRTRRDFPKYLTLIRAVALLHQYQRPVKTVQHEGATVEYVEATLDDVAVANRLAASVLGRSLDELPPQTRRLLSQLTAFVARECEAKKVRREDLRFTRRELREALRAGDTQLKVHLARLAELELLAVHRVAHGGFAYALRAGEATPPALHGLADVAALSHAYDESNGPTGRGAVGPRSAPPPTGGKLKSLLPLAALEGHPVGGGAKAHSPLNGAAVTSYAAAPGPEPRR